jgi:hypothetical protein
MQTAELSEAAVATLRFEIKGWKKRVRDQDLPAYRELVAAGIMEPDGERFRLTEWGRANGREVVEQECGRIDRERYEPPDASGLSGSAKALLRRIVRGQVEVTRRNRRAFRELAAARIVTLGHSFTKGDESVYRWTYWGYRQRSDLARGCEPTSRLGKVVAWLQGWRSGVPATEALTGPANPSPSPHKSPSPAR